MDGLFKNNSRFMLYTLKWMSIYIAIGLVAALIFPFPMSLIVALGGFVLVNFLRTRLMMKSRGLSMEGLFDSLRTSNVNSSSSIYGYNPVKYYCMGCGTQHNEIACPKCGSKMKRVG